MSLISKYPNSQSPITQLPNILLRCLLIIFFICCLTVTSAFCDLTPNVKIASQVPHNWNDGLVGYWTMDGEDISGTTGLFIPDGSY